MTLFGTAIQQLREQLGLSQRDLAAQLGISATYLNDIEHGRRHDPPRDRIATIARVLGVSSDWLYYLSGRVPPDLNRSYDEATVRAAWAAFHTVLNGDAVAPASHTEEA